MANKAERQATILELIASRQVGSQEELRRLLLQRGWDVTQSTLSRDLRELRLARVPTTDGGVRYSVTGVRPEELKLGLETLLPPLFTAIDAVGELIVLHTHTGGAQPVALAIDAEEWPDVLGTIAGDDTILIICRSTAARERIARRIRALAGTEEPGRGARGGGRGNGS